MVLAITTCGGQDALDTLSSRLEKLRTGSPLDPALIVCPSAVVAVGVRRALGRRSGGIAGVRTTTVSGLVAELVRKPLAESAQHMATSTELVAAIRTELVEAPGMFAAVARHRSTDERLLGFHQELLGVEPGPLALMQREAQGLSADALRVVTAASENPTVGLSGHRLVQLFCDQLDRLEPGGLGPVVLYQPDPMRPFDARILRALARRDDVEVHLGLTGHEPADSAYLDRLAGWGIAVGTNTASALPRFEANVFEVPDPEDEVRAAVRTVSELAATGVGLAETAIVYGQAEPYASMLFSLLDEAGLAFGGPGHKPLSASLSGRTLRRLVALASTGLGREAVITFLAASPIDDGSGLEAPSVKWDELSRQAGVIDDDHWELRLERLEQVVGEDEAAPIAALARFVAELRKNLALPDPVTWSGLARWASELLDRYLLVSDRWPDDELLSDRRVRAVLAELGRLDRVGKPDDLETFEALLTTELSAAMMPGRPMGHGIHIGPVASLAGLAFTQVCVVGLSEGQFPRASREDSLLTDNLRARAGLMEKGELSKVDLRRVAVAVSASRRPAMLTTARGDLRSNRARSWPRALDPLVASRTTLGSHYQGILSQGRPPSIEEFNLRALTAHVASGEPIDSHELASIDPVLGQSLRRAQSRQATKLGPFTGKVSEGLVNPLERPLSPTALETYAQCPRRYLFSRVLRVRASEAPERISSITPLEQGNIVHLVLERFYTEAIDGGQLPTPNERWPLAQRAALFEVLEQEVKKAESLGLTGGRVRTLLLHTRLVRWFDSFLSADDELRAQYSSTPAYAEYRFGMDSAPPLTSWGGRSMRLRGSVDRIDTTADGGILVIDYKTGRPDSFSDLESNPLKGGTRLQLPLYALDTARRLNRNGPLIGLYWLVANDQIKHLELDADRQRELEEMVATIVDGIGQGLFPAVPGPIDSWKNSFVNCRHCDFQQICPTDRLREWSSVQDDPHLRTIQPILESLDPTVESRSATEGSPGAGDETR